MASPQSRNLRSSSVDHNRLPVAPKMRARSHSAQRQRNDEVHESIAAQSAAQMVEAVVASGSSSAARQRSGSNNSRRSDRSGGAYNAPRRRRSASGEAPNEQEIIAGSHFRPRANSHDAGAGRNPSLAVINPNFRPRSNSHDAGSTPMVAAAAAAAMGDRVMDASQSSSSSRPSHSRTKKHTSPKKRSVSAGKRNASDNLSDSPSPKPRPKQRSRSHDHRPDSSMGSQEESSSSSTTLRSASAERPSQTRSSKGESQGFGLERIISGVPLEATLPAIHRDKGKSQREHDILEQDDHDSDKQSQHSFYSMDEGHSVEKTFMPTREHQGDSAVSDNQDARLIESHSASSDECIPESRERSKQSNAPSAASIEHIVNVEEEGGRPHPPETASEHSMKSAVSAHEPEVFGIEPPSSPPMQRSTLDTAENEIDVERPYGTDIDNQESQSGAGAHRTRDHHNVGAPRRKMHMSHGALFGLGGTGVVLILVCCIGMPLSLQNVPTNHVAIKVNSYTNKVDYSRAYSEGRYFAPFTDFLLFPTVVSTMVEKVTARARDGYPLTVRFGLQYYLDPDNILELYKKYSRGYTEVFRRESRNIMMKTISKYSSSSFYQNREDIIKDMFKEVCQKLLEKYASCWGLQFTEVGLAPALEQRLLRLELDRWYVFRKEGEQQISQVNSITEVIEAEFQRDMSVTESNSSTSAKIITESGKSEAKLIKRGVEAACDVISREAEALAARVEKQAEIDSWKITAEAEKKAKLIEFKAIADKFSIVEEARSKASVIRATAEAEATRAFKAATGAGRHRLLLAQGKSMQFMSSLLGLSSAGLLKYEKLTSTAKYNQSRILFGDYQGLHVGFLPRSEEATKSGRRLYAAKGTQRESALRSWQARWSKMMSRMIAKTGYCDSHSCSFTNKKNEL